MAASSSTCSWVSIPSEQATLISTASWIALTPSRTWFINRSSGPRTAATMQNSVAPVLAVSFAAVTSEGMSSQAERTGESKTPDCEQKWQSSGQPPVLSETMPSTSTSSPHHLTRTSWARSSSSSTRSSGSCRHWRACSSLSPRPCSRTWVRATSRMSTDLLRSVGRQEGGPGERAAEARRDRRAGALTEVSHRRHPGWQDARDRGHRGEVGEVAAGGEIGVGRPAADDEIGEPDALLEEAVDSERGVVESAEARG